jgi:hypothetical protein
LSRYYHIMESAAYTMSSPIARTLLARNPSRASPYARLTVRTGAWIVTPREGRPQDAIAIYNPQRLRGKLAKRLLRHGLWLAPSVQLDNDAVRDLESVLGDCLGGIAVRCAFYFRSPDYKTIALALDAEGRPVAYVKFGSSVETNVAIAHEGHVLDRLAEVEGLKERIPRVLARTVWRSFPALLLSVGPSKQLPAEYGAVHREFLRDLQDATAWRGELRDCAMWKAMVARYELIAPQHEPRWRDRYAWLLQHIRDCIGNVALPFSLAHRDFVPWNIHANDAGDLFVLDWGRAGDQCVPAWDFFHFHLAMRARGERRIDPLALSDLLALAESEGVASPEAFLLSYLGDMGLSLNETPAGPKGFLGFIEDAIDTLRAGLVRPARRATAVHASDYRFAPVMLRPVLNPANDD